MRSCNARATVSVVLPVFNGLPYLQEAVDSVLAQSYDKWELLIVDDGSTDDSKAIYTKLTPESARVRVLKNEQNIGLAATLNRALDAARGKYIARLDSDDLMLPTRLATQVEFMDSNPQVGVLGSASLLVDDGGVESGVQRMPACDEEIRWHEMTARSASFVHPAVMLRTKVLREHGLRYDESLRSAQDKRMWLDTLRHCRGANLEEPLIQYRQHGMSISATRRLEQRENAEQVCLHWMQQTLDHPVDAEVAIRLLNWNRPVQEADLVSWELCGRLLEAMDRLPDTQSEVMQQIRVQIGFRLLRYASPRLWPRLCRSRILKSLLGCAPSAFLRYGREVIGVGARLTENRIRRPA